ncbi:MAG: FKBP-type peptidyl-prolyl cis-trans isomerase [Phycisphaerales bacterium]
MIRTIIATIACTASSIAIASLNACGPADPPDNQSSAQPATPAPHSPQHSPSNTPDPAPDETLRITTLSEGRGDPAPADAIVTIEFNATIAGQDQPFDSTDRRRQPMTLPLDSPGLIEGLRQGIAGMRPGERRRLHIPAELAYGPTGRHPIPPDADLIYDITLLTWTTPQPSD